MNYTKFTEAYKKVLTESTDDSELRNLVRGIVEEILTQDDNAEEDNLTEEDNLNFRDKYSTVSTDLENVLESVKDLVESFNDAYEQTEDKSEMSDVGYDITELLKETLAKIQEYYVMSKRNR